MSFETHEVVDLSPLSVPKVLLLLMHASIGVARSATAEDRQHTAALRHSETRCWLPGLLHCSSTVEFSLLLSDKGSAALTIFGKAISPFCAEKRTDGW